MEMRWTVALAFAATVIASSALAQGSPPKGWTYLPELGPKDIFEVERYPTHGPVPQIRARTMKDVGILQKEIDVPLTASTTLQWRWIVKQLPSTIAEDVASAHDYFSIAVKFDNGQDLTYMWSSSLPYETGFRCPLRNWKDRETHVVVRSGKQDLRRWTKERRTLLSDYIRFVGGEPPKRITHVWLIANSTIQKTTGEASFGGISLGDESRGRTRVL